MRRAAFLSAAALVALAPRIARADDTDTKIAQQLFDEGRALLDQDRVPEACVKFAESQRLDPGGGTLLNLAVCHEREGKTGTAWTEFHEGLAQAVKDERKDREALARQHIEALRPKLVRILVVVPPEVAANKPEILLDRSRLPEAAWGSAIPVDPGEHRVSASAEYMRPWSVTVSASEPGRTYDVSVPPGEPPERSCPSGTVRVKDTCVALEPSRPSGESRRSVAFWIVLGGSAGVAMASLVTGIVAFDQNQYVKDNCSAERDFCRVNDASDAASRAKTFAWVSTVTLGLAVTGGVVAFLLPKVDAAGGTRAKLEIGPGMLRVTGM